MLGHTLLGSARCCCKKTAKYEIVIDDALHCYKMVKIQLFFRLPLLVRRQQLILSSLKNNYTYFICMHLISLVQFVKKKQEQLFFHCLNTFFLCV